jgi:hypothetical protein
MSWSWWASFDGQCGHQNVPGNLHWDPGRADYLAIAKAARPTTPEPEDDDMPPPVIARTSDGRAWLIGPHFRTRVQGQADLNLCKLIHHARVDKAGQPFTNLPDEWILSHVDTESLP